MDVAYLLHFQASLKANGVVYASADKECIVDICEFRSKPLDTLLILKNLFNLIGESLYLGNKLIEAFIGYLLTYLGKLHGKQITGYELRAVCLCCGN